MGSPNLVPIPGVNDTKGIIRAIALLASSRLNADSQPTFADLTIRGELTTNALLTDYIDFNLTPTVTPQEGRAYWDTDDGTLNIGMPGGSVNLQMGQEILIRCRNTTGTLIANGAAVRISGASGGKALIELADASDVNTGLTGLATEDIADNSNGYINIKGMVRDFDTSAYAPGTHLFLNSGGGLTNVPASGNNRKAFVGTVIVQGAENGSVLIQPQNSPFLSGLSGVDITSIADGQVIAYDSATSSWKNVTPSSGVTTFVALTDTPADYTGETLKAVRVNAGETALEFYTPSGGGASDHGALTGLGDVEDHLLYLDLAGTRPMTGDLDMDGNDITSANILPDTDGIYDIGSNDLVPGTPVVEQEQTLQNNGSLVGITNRGGQTFTTVDAFNISQIDIGVYVHTAPVNDIVVSLYAVDGSSFPTGPALATGSTPVGEVGASQGDWTTIVFDLPYALEAATMYAICIEPTDTGYAYTYRTSDVYAGGNRMWSIDSGTTWNHTATHDLQFRLYSTASVFVPLFYRDLFLAGDLDDGTVSLSIAEAKIAYDHSVSSHADGSLYLHLDGSQAMTGDLDFDANDLFQTGHVAPDADDTYNLGSKTEDPMGNILWLSQPVNNTGDPLSSTKRRGNTFTPDKDLNTVRIRVNLVNTTGGTGDVICELFATSAGKPTGPALGSVTVDGTDITDVTTGEWVDFYFDPYVSLSDGVMYAFAVRTAESFFRINLATSSQYSGGTWVQSDNGGGWWDIVPSFEVVFEIYEGGDPSFTYKNYANLYLSDKLSDGTNEVTIAQLVATHESSFALRTETADYDIVVGDFTVLVDTASNAVTITLPASPVQGQMFNIKCIDDTNTCTIARNGNNIDGAAADVTLLITESAALQYDSTYGWAIL